MSQGQATRSTLMCSRVIHFIAWFSFLLCRIASTAKRTNRGAKRGGLSHLAFLIDGDSTTGQKHIEALPQCIVGRGVRPHFCGELVLDRHALSVHYVDDTRRLIEDTEVRDSHIEATKPVIMPDGIWRACNRNPRLFSPAGEIERDNRASIASHKRPAALLIEVQPMRPRAPDGEPLNQRERFCRERCYAGRLANIDEKAVSRLLVDSPARATRKLHLRHHLACLRVDQLRPVLLDISHQQVVTSRVPGQAVGFLPDCNRS